VQTSLQSVQTSSGAQPASYSMVTGVKHSEHETDHSPPSSDKD